MDDYCSISIYVCPGPFFPRHRHRLFVCLFVFVRSSINNGKSDKKKDGERKKTQKERCLENKAAFDTWARKTATKNITFCVDVDVAVAVVAPIHN